MGPGNRLASSLTGRLSARNLFRWPFRDAGANRIARQCRGMSDHVIVCGYGALGRSLVAILEWQGIRTLVLEADHQRTEHGGPNVLCGDFCRPGVISAAGLESARAVALTFADIGKALKMQKRIHAIRPDVPVLAYGGDRRGEERLHRSGANVFPGDLELSLAFGRQLMFLLGESSTTLEEKLQILRADNYRQLRMLAEGPPTSGTEHRPKQ